MLQLVTEHELYANLSKCKFVQPELHFLGHVVGAQGLRVDPAKIVVVRDWPVPTNRTSLQKFWGLANYLRKFVMGWANLISALQTLLKQADTFEWNEQCDSAFAGIKHVLCIALVLALLSRLLNSNTGGVEMTPFKLRDSDKQSRQEKEVNR